MRFLDRKPKAQADIIDYRNYYAAISSELAEDFLKEIEASFTYLLENPGTGSNRYAHLLGGKLKHWTIDRFPFVVFYLYDDESVKIIRFLHAHMSFTQRLFR